MLEKILQMFHTTTLLFVTISLLLLEYSPPWWWLFKSKISQKNINTIPGPRSLPVFGTCWLFTTGTFTFNRLHCYYEYLFNKYGKIVKEEAIFNIPIIHLFDKQDIEKVLKSGGKYPLRPPTEAVAYYRKSRPDRYASSGLVNEQGESWYLLRTTLTPALTSPRTISNFLPQAQEIADDWCNLIKHQRNQSNCVIDDMHQIAGRLGLEMACALVLGRRMGFLLPDVETEIARKLANSIQEYFIATRDTYFGIPLWKLYQTKAYKNLVKSEETIYELVLDLIKTADDSTRDSIVYQSIINANIDIRERTAAIIDFIAAGIHTMKNSFLFLLHLIGNNKKIQENLLNDPTKAYLKACLNESFRLYPTAFSLARILEHNMELSSGYRLKSGTVVICHTGLACRNEAYFNKAKEFRPERWLNDEKTQTVSNSAFILTPFGLGRRICPGKRLIEQILPVLLENTVKNFQLESVHVLETQFEFLLSPKAPLAIRFTDRI